MPRNRNPDVERQARENYERRRINTERHIHIRMPIVLANAIQAAACRRHITFSEIMREALEERFLKKEK